MANMTYKQLGAIISRMNDSELEQNVTVYLTGIDELFAVERVATVKEDDVIGNVLDPGSVVLEVRDGN